MIKTLKLIYKILSFPDSVLSRIMNFISNNILLKTDKFSWKHAILYSHRVDQWHRYSSVVNQINSLSDSPCEVLDVGGGSGIIREFIDQKKYKITVLDINPKMLKNISDQKIKRIIGDGCSLPFKDNSFDIVISIDSLEHVPSEKKFLYCSELKRVAKKHVILHCPADNSDGRYEGTKYDTLFFSWFYKTYRFYEPNTLEHLNNRLPKIEDLHQIFPGSTIIGKQNAIVWLSYIKCCFIPYIRFFAGVYYLLFLKKYDDLPPFHACLLIWKK